MSFSLLMVAARESRTDIYLLWNTFSRVCMAHYRRRASEGLGTQTAHEADLPGDEFLHKEKGSFPALSVLQ